MTVISTSFDTAVSNFVKDILLPRKYASSFIRNYLNISYDDSSFCSSSLPNAIKHNIKSYDNETLESFEIRNNTSYNYLFLLHGVNQKIEDIYKLIEGFSCFNIVIIKNRDEFTFGLKESKDLKAWIDYYKINNPNISICLFGEFEGANFVIKTLKDRLDESVKCAILDDPNTTIIDELFEKFKIKKSVDSIHNIKREVNIKLKKEYGYTLKELDLKGYLNNNHIPLCFVYSKVKSNYRYKKLLQLFNSTKGDHKIFLTSSLERNYKQENYFLTLTNFIKIYF